MTLLKIVSKDKDENISRAAAQALVEAETTYKPFVSSYPRAVWTYIFLAGVIIFSVAEIAVYFEAIDLFQSIAFLSDRVGRWAIWLMNVDGSNAREWLPLSPDWGEVDPDRVGQERTSWSR